MQRTLPKTGLSKTAKGAIAAVAAVLLLAGGFGSYALWNDSATLPGGTVNSGELTIATEGDGTWTDLNPVDGQSADWNPATDTIVPGDRIELGQDVVITATGKNLVADLNVDTSGITGDTELQDALEITVTLSKTGSDDVVITPGTPVTITSADAGTYSAHVVFELPDSVKGTTAQNESVDLSQVGYTLSQQPR
ncbi:alternate-type signal peptide domain-containing protein [Spelaeicoccus albus]|uniref:Alternate signal-mediated exported protein n=1 Tax=Spelaeicoccus albus TaxID=1280376 RepID=A0A7Z0D524_9MICO|nr:alternate-type signal peptide domain-containing protein [Spelaeicoccus albus]NYI68956.1 alternate signal-mediated exported protein [Spelaeicoccus albus]